MRDVQNTETTRSNVTEYIHKRQEAREADTCRIPFHQVQIEVELQNPGFSSLFLMDPQMLSPKLLALLRPQSVNLGAYNCVQEESATHGLRGNSA